MQPWDQKGYDAKYRRWLGRIPPADADGDGGGWRCEVEDYWPGHPIRSQRPDSCHPVDLRPYVYAGRTHFATWELLTT